MANALEYYYTRDISRDLPYQQYMRDTRENSDRQIAAIGASTAVLAGGMQGIQTSIDTQTYEIMASRDAIRRELGQGFNAVNNTLTWGFSGVANALGSMSSNISMGFARTGAAIDRMSKDICDCLDAIDDMLNNPRRTAARELYRRALVNYRKGFYAEALPDIDEAIEQDKTDALSWFLRGQIFASGVGETGSVIDLDKAIEAFNTAARYNKPSIAGSKDARRFAAEIYFYLGLGQYAKSNELLRTGNKEEAAKQLAEAQKSFEQSYRYSEEMLESLYNAIRCKVLQIDKANVFRADVLGSEGMVSLIAKDWKYYIKAKKDTDFSSVYKELDEVVKRMRDMAYKHTVPVFGQIVEGYEQAKQEGLIPYFSNDERMKIEKCLREGLDKNLPYLDMLDRCTRIRVLAAQIA